MFNTSTLCYRNSSIIFGKFTQRSLQLYQYSINNLFFVNMNQRPFPGTEVKYWTAIHRQCKTAAIVKSQRAFSLVTYRSVLSPSHSGWRVTASLVCLYCPWCSAAIHVRFFSDLDDILKARRSPKLLTCRSRSGLPGVLVHPPLPDSAERRFSAILRSPRF